MQETTQPLNPPETPAPVPAGTGWCSWHGGHGRGLVLISAVEQASGPGVNHRACTDCRAKYGLVPFGEQR
ncbi:hypothetical protein ACIQJX_07440 [Streptomyces griseoviridis]